MAKKINHRWGSDFHNIPDLKHIKVNNSLLQKIERTRTSSYDVVLNANITAAKFSQVRDPCEFNANIRREVQELGPPVHQINAFKLPQYDGRNDVKKKTSSVVPEVTADVYFGRRELDFKYSQTDFPDISQSVPNSVKKVPKEGKEKKKITVDKPETQFRCLEITDLPQEVNEEELKTYLEDFGEVRKINLIKNPYEPLTTALVWITRTACEWVISCLDDQLTVIKDLEVKLQVNYKSEE